jgi:predicted DNA-binding transcriptional regulator AlpA
MSTLNTQQLMQIFGVSHMTVYQWRQGTATKKKLPATVGKPTPRSVAFDPVKVETWASKHDVPLLYDPVKLADTGKLVAVPKAKAKRVKH